MEHGSGRLGMAIADNCRQAQISRPVFEHPRLRLLAPVALNIVCCRFWSPDLAADQLDR